MGVRGRGIESHDERVRFLVCRDSPMAAQWRLIRPVFRTQITFGLMKLPFLRYKAGQG